MRIYAKREDNGVDVLIKICCDGCDTTIRPNPHIQDSDWMKEGFSDGPGEPYITNNWCPECYGKRRLR